MVNTNNHISDELDKNGLGAEKKKLITQSNIIFLFQSIMTRHTQLTKTYGGELMNVVF